MTIGDRIKALRTKKSMSLEDLGKSIGVGRTTILRYETGVISNIPSDKIESLAVVLGVSPAYLMGWEDKNPLSFRNIIPYDTEPLPLIGRIACGKPILCEENIEDYVPVLKEIKGNFCLRCRGDSMINAGIEDGCIVVIREQPSVDNGNIAAVLIADDDSDGTEATLKRVYMTDDTLVLSPENPAYSPLVFTGEDMNRCRILGKAVANVRPL